MPKGRRTRRVPPPASATEASTTTNRPTTRRAARSRVTILPTPSAVPSAVPFTTAQSPTTLSQPILQPAPILTTSAPPPVPPTPSGTHNSLPVTAPFAAAPSVATTLSVDQLLTMIRAEIQHAGSFSTTASANTDPAGTNSVPLVAATSLPGILP